jgi:hypothetical protein
LLIAEEAACAEECPKAKQKKKRKSRASKQNAKSLGAQVGELATDEPNDRYDVQVQTV